MVSKKTWAEFRKAGLLLFINQILHIFGWAIVFQIDDQTGEITDVYPARVKFRGFDNKSVSECYQSLTNWMYDNINELKSEADE